MPDERQSLPFPGAGMKARYLTPDRARSGLLNGLADGFAERCISTYIRLDVASLVRLASGHYNLR
jgi:hypothetical protein